MTSVVIICFSIGTWWNFKMRLKLIILKYLYGAVRCSAEYSTKFLNIFVRINTLVHEDNYFCLDTVSRVYELTCNVVHHS